MKTRFLNFLAVFSILGLVWAPAAYAHVVVTPATAAPGERVTFNVSVPNEKDVDVVGIKLTVPSGLASVTPTVHTGWTITTEKNGETVQTVSWTGGQIPTGQRDDFTFRAQVPAENQELQWKVVQQYADGTSVAWDQKPTTESSAEESETNGPYSVTKVTEPAVDSAAANTKSSSNTTLPLAISLIALVVAAAALLRKKA